MDPVLTYLMALSTLVLVGLSQCLVRAVFGQDSVFRRTCALFIRVIYGLAGLASIGFGGFLLIYGIYIGFFVEEIDADVVGGGAIAYSWIFLLPGTGLLFFAFRRQNRRAPTA